MIETNEITIGADWDGFSLRFNDPNGAPYDFTGAVFHSNVQHRETGRRYPVTITVGAVAHELVFTMPRAVTKSLPVGRLDMNVLCDRGGKRHALPVTGIFEAKRSPTLVVAP